MLTQAMITQIMTDGLITTQLAAGAGTEVRLFKNDFEPLTSSVLADFTEADFDGYVAAPQSNNWLLRTDAMTGLLTAFCGDTISFSAGAPETNPQILYGYYLVSDAGVLIGGYRFNTPALIGTVGDHFEVNPEILFATSLEAAA